MKMEQAGVELLLGVADKTENLVLFIHKKRKQFYFCHLLSYYKAESEFLLYPYSFSLPLNLSLQAKSYGKIWMLPLLSEVIYVSL